MAKEYKVGEKYYLPVTVERIVEGEFGVTLSYTDGDEGDTVLIWNAPDLLLTANEIAENIAGRRCAECLIMYDEVKARNAELEALLKEVTATRDEAIRQNDELITENKKLKAENGAWQIAAQTCADNAKVADKATEELRKENKDLKAKVAENADTISRLSANKVALTEEVGRLRETIADRTIDVQHLTEENDKLKTELDQRKNDVLAMKEDRDTLLAENEKLKAERDDLASQLGKNLAEIQALTSDVHFFKETCAKQSAAYDELKGRYDELDSVNQEQAEKIRSLDKTVAKLKDENTNLSFLLEAKPEEEVNKPVHVFTNDGTEVEFRRYTDVTYRTDYNILVIKDGEEIVAGFIRGDRPRNLAYWWTE